MTTTLVPGHRPTPPRPVPDLVPTPGPPGPRRRRLPPAPGAHRSVVPIVLLLAILAVSFGLGHLAAPPARSLLHDRMLPWILGRSLGVATYLALTATVVLGLWLRHPWRARVRQPSAEAILWAHVALAACTLALLVGHLSSLALDRYAGVGWHGALVPWGSSFRPTAVALGTCALYLLVLVVGTAALAGSIGRAVWFPIHTAAVFVFCTSLAHGVLSGSDSVSLRWVYVASGCIVLVLQLTRWVAGTLRHGSAVVVG